MIPSGCPRELAARPETGQLCALVHCRYHCGAPGLRGSLPSRRRPLGDDCALAIAERGLHSQRQVAAALGVTPQAVALIEDRALARLLRSPQKKLVLELFATHPKLLIKMAKQKRT